MRAVQRLRRDHVSLRTTLDVIERALRLEPAAWFVVRDLCRSVARQLESHVRREEALLAICRAGLDREQLEHMGLEHDVEPALLRTVNQLFADESGHSVARARPVLTVFIQGLRRHMDEEEARLFPAMEELLAGYELDSAWPGDIGAPLIEASSAVREVVDSYPATREVFRRLLINVVIEGPSRLDDVARRHRMACQDLVELLEQAVESGLGAEACSEERGELSDLSCRSPV